MSSISGIPAIPATPISPEIVEKLVDLLASRISKAATDSFKDISSEETRSICKSIVMKHMDTIASKPDFIAFLKSLNDIHEG